MPDGEQRPRIPTRTSRQAQLVRRELPRPTPQLGHQQTAAKRAAVSDEHLHQHFLSCLSIANLLSVHSMSKVSSNSSADRGGGAFLSTRWSLVITARGPTSTVAQSALDELCRIYWYPLYCFIRRRGYTPADAEDLVQGFFVHMFRRHFFEQADPAQGRLRGFLLQSLDYFLTDQHRHQAAIKRGGEVEIVPLDLTGVQERYSHEPATNETPEECYDRQWALLLLQRVIATLGEMWRQKGKAELYAALTPYFYAELDGANAEALAIRFFGYYCFFIFGNFKTKTYILRKIRTALFLCFFIFGHR